MSTTVKKSFILTLMTWKSYSHNEFPNVESLYLSRWDLDDVLQGKDFSALKELAIDGESYESTSVKLGSLPLEFKDLV